MDADFPYGLDGPVMTPRRWGRTFSRIQPEGTLAPSRNAAETKVPPAEQSPVDTLRR